MDLSRVVWRKARLSAENGGNCVELGEAWRKSSHSVDNGGNCVELAGASGRLVAVRDSKDPDGPVLLMEPSTLRAAVRAAMSQPI
jgi:hypothetical protein